MTKLKRAENRIVELEAGLKDICDIYANPTGNSLNYGGDAADDKMVTIARRLLEAEE